MSTLPPSDQPENTDAPTPAQEVFRAPGTFGPGPAFEEPATAAPAATPGTPFTREVAPLGRSRSPWTSKLSVILVAALVGGLAGHFTSGSSLSGLGVSTSNSSPGAAILPNGTGIPSLVKSVLPSVVSIDVKANGQEDQGTGMIITPNGYVVTNNHVIAAAVSSGTITVTRSGSTKSLPAHLVGTNPIDDVALIQIDGASNLPTVTFGNSNALQVGDAVIAIGNALGLAAGTPTVTQGIVSAMGRTVTASSSNGTETLSNMIQTDAAINPGNSGGPLLDDLGHVIGMNTAVAGTSSDGTSAQNIGFAIPVATIESLLKSLKAGASVKTNGAYLGVEITSMTSSLQLEYGFSVSTGAVVMSVISGTAAQRAGIQQGDVIVKMNGVAIGGAQDVASVLAPLHPGDRVTIGLVRGTQHLTVTATLTSK